MNTRAANVLSYKSVLAQPLYELSGVERVCDLYMCVRVPSPTFCNHNSCGFYSTLAIDGFQSGPPVARVYCYSIGL